MGKPQSINRNRPTRKHLDFTLGMVISIGHKPEGTSIHPRELVGAAQHSYPSSSSHHSIPLRIRSQGTSPDPLTRRNFTSGDLADYKNLTSRTCSWISKDKEDFCGNFLRLVSGEKNIATLLLPLSLDIFLKLSVSSFKAKN